MPYYKVDDINITPLLILAKDADDAEAVLVDGFVNGMGAKPDVTFEIARIGQSKKYFPKPLRDWLDSRRRGIIWHTQDGEWELISKAPD